MAPRALIVGLAGPELSAAEAAFLAECEPWGVIVFARNVADRGQVEALAADVRRALARSDAPILVDQEGGRVQRLCPPEWPRYPAAQRIGEVYEIDAGAGLEAARLSGRLIAHDLVAIGITITCMPVLDVRRPETHAVIGDRAYSGDPASVARLAEACAEGVLDGGCLPVIKHIPGHGRARSDSHVELPVVDADDATLEACDFAPFRALRHLPIAMTAHILYQALDDRRPATLSAPIIDQVIRRRIGFDGLLMSDDLSMHALAGTIAERASAAIAAGCDIALHCNGDLGEMTAAAAATPPLEGCARERADAAIAALRKPIPFDVEAARRRLGRIIDASAERTGP